MTLRLESSLAASLPSLAHPTPLRSFPSPELLVFNDALATTLGLSQLGEDAADLLTPDEGRRGVEPVALAYSGHQFGSFSPQLGDGRALLIGEWVDPTGRRLDLQLKGSGRTAFSRGGDGKAALGPVLREYLVSEAMFHLGVPTTRVLCAWATGEIVQRERPLPGALLCRVAASHLRVGTFEYLAAREQRADIARLVDYSLERHHPGERGDERPAVALLRSVARAQAELIAQWMLVGFIHGVMNTDNVTISGETIDYGPCAFMDTYAQNTVFSSIDLGGRYAYKNQPLIGKWNLARLAETLLPLLADEQELAVERAMAELDAYSRHYDEVLLDGMRRKMGLLNRQEDDLDLVKETLTFFEEEGFDFTSAFRSWAADLRRLGQPQWGPKGQGLAARFADRQGAPEETASRMDRINPLYVPRNHLVEEALASARQGDLEPMHRFVEVLRRPFERQPGRERYEQPAPEEFGPYKTFCGT